MVISAKYHRRSCALQNTLSSACASPFETYTAKMNYSLSRVDAMNSFRMGYGLRIANGGGSSSLALPFPSHQTLSLSPIPRARRYMLGCENITFCTTAPGQHICERALS